MTELQSRLDPRRRAQIRHMVMAEAAAGPAPTRHRMALAGALAVAVVGTGAVGVATYPDRPADHGPWTAVPQAAPPLTAPDEDIEKWASKCSDLGVGGVGIEGVPAGRAAAARREVLVDRRGGFTYCVDVSMGSGTAADPLIALSGLKSDDLNSMWSTVSDKPFTEPRGRAVLVLGGNVEATPAPARGELQAYQLYGLSGADVTGVDLVLANGLRVTATLRGGIWGVWWPSDRGEPTGSRLEVHTAAGISTVDPRSVQLPIG
ncbi:hypothetical protein KOI35_07235 [Actinoplanes bogorensis]|uniref:Uncharacterized protein n=1 Tax=Paractinoplanes bogorensis TaxID=1610840 RepID=A0ABS5YIX3_9ACTN|nr:hypothetical protein [Actinoplanes bogorensis]MBU2663301.1 hypothetical protein [Actinoplanes bogorensis]